MEGFSLFLLAHFVILSQLKGTMFEVSVKGVPCLKSQLKGTMFEVSVKGVPCFKSQLKEYHVLSLS